MLAHNDRVKTPLLLYDPHCNEAGLTVNLGLQTPSFLAIPVMGSGLKVQCLPPAHFQDKRHLCWAVVQ